MAAEPRYQDTERGLTCLDCGSYIADRPAHTRFHSILSGHAWALAILKNSHVSDEVHARYDVAERESRRKFDSWSADALAEVTKGERS
jgi:hypothetical protein